MPAHYDDAHILSILTYLREKYVHTFKSEFSNAAFEAFFLRRLQSEDMAQSSKDAIFITDIAKRGKHPAADMALRKCILVANRESRFDQLPLAVRAFNDEVLMEMDKPIVEYPSQCPQIINDYIQNLTIGGLVEVVRTKLPHLPRWNSDRQLSATGLVANAFGLSERNVYRIYKKHKQIPQLVADFFREHHAGL